MGNFCQTFVNIYISKNVEKYKSFNNLGFLLKITKMPKEYFCKKIKDDIICGEKDPEKFSTGRYSICKECKRREIYNIQKNKREKKLLEKITSIDSVIKGTDLKNTILKLPLLNGESIKNNIESIVRTIDELEIHHNNSINIMNLNIAIFQKSQNELQKKYDDLKVKYDEVMKYCMDMRYYIVQMNDKNSGPYVPKESITD